MIFNCQNRSEQTKNVQLNTSLHKSISINSSSSTLESKISRQSSFNISSSKMTTLRVERPAANTNKKQIVKAPTKAVVVNSIIYSKPSYCMISVDLSDMPFGKKSTIKTTLTNGSCGNGISCISEGSFLSSVGLNESSANVFDTSHMTDFDGYQCLDVGEDAKLYRICTTLNDSINHQISELCDNIFNMNEFYRNEPDLNSEPDDDSFIEFAYAKDADDDDDGDDGAFTDDDCDDDSDVVDFLYDCPIETTPKFSCDKKKKVRFNTKPTIHKMITWDYAYRAARVGRWHIFATDREHFKMRIQRTALKLNPILDWSHRQKIFETRFANLYSNDNDRKEVSTKIMGSMKIYNNESKKIYQKNKRKKRRYCKMGNKHYF